MKTLLILALLWPSAVLAQVAPGVFTTLKTTSTSATGLCVGCPAGTSTPALNSGGTFATITMREGVPSVTTLKIYSSGGALFYNGLALATGSSISGTTNTVSKFTAPTVLGDSIITDNGTTVTIAGAEQVNSTITSGTSGVTGTVLINGPTATNRVVGWRTAGLNRWFAYATNVAESGANAGSNFRLDAYDDAGTLIGTTLLATRSSLAVTLGGALTVTGASVLSGATTVATSLQLVGAAPVYLANSNNGYLFRNAANGATLLGITDAGVGTFTGAYTHTGITTFTAAPVFSSGTASQTMELDSGKALVTVAITGTGNYVKSAGPTMTGTIGAASMTLSGTLGVTGVATLTAQPILSSLTASLPVFTDGSKGLVSNAMTGTGSVVMSASPTLTGTAALPIVTATGAITSTANSATFALDFQGANGGGITASNAAGALRFYTASSTLRWGINAAGDWVFGASSRVADSNGVPTIASGFGSSPTIAGTDYAMVITLGSGAGNVGGNITLGHNTFSAAPVCVASSTLSAISTDITVDATTSTVSLGWATGTYTGNIVRVLCRGY